MIFLVAFETAPFPAETAEVAKVVAKYGVPLTVEDVLPISEVSTATLPVLVTLVADPAGFNWTGQLDLLLVV